MLNSCLYLRAYWCNTLEISRCSCKLFIWDGAVLKVGSLMDSSTGLARLQR